MGWKEESRKEMKSRNEGNTFKFAEGENIIRILPNKRGLGEDGAYVSKFSPFLIFATHPNVGPKKRFARCGKDKNGEGECWLCDTKIPKLERSDKEGLQKKALAMAKRDQVLFQVAYLDSDAQKWRGPKPLYLGLGKKKALGNRLVSFISTSNKREYEHPLKGFNLMIERSGQGLDTTYSDIQAEDDASKVKDYILKKLQSFGELIGKYSSEGQEALYLGKDVPEEEEEDQSEMESAAEEADEKPKPGKKPKKPDPDEEEGEGDEGEGEEGDEDKPKPGKKPKKPDPDEEEGAEEEAGASDEAEGAEGDEGDEEENKPKKPKPGKKPKKPDPDEEEGEGDEGEGEEEEMAHAKTKPGKKPKKPDPDEEEGDEGDE